MGIVPGEFKDMEKFPPTFMPFDKVSGKYDFGELAKRKGCRFACKDEL